MEFGSLGTDVTMNRATWRKSQKLFAWSNTRCAANLHGQTQDVQKFK